MVGTVFPLASNASQTPLRRTVISALKCTVLSGSLCVDGGGDFNIFQHALARSPLQAAFALQVSSGSLRPALTVPSLISGSRARARSVRTVRPPVVPALITVPPRARDLCEVCVSVRQAAGAHRIVANRIAAELPAPNVPANLVQRHERQRPVAATAANQLAGHVAEFVGGYRFRGSGGWGFHERIFFLPSQGCGSDSWTPSKEGCPNLSECPDGVSERGVRTCPKVSEIIREATATPPKS